MKALLALALILGSAATGCSGASRVSYSATAAHATPPRPTEAVDVLLDSKPDRPFKVVGELEARTLDSPRSIELMRAEAARSGLDGIYWIECASISCGHCKAKGFVYTTLVSRADVEGTRSASR